MKYGDNMLAKPCLCKKISGWCKRALSIAAVNMRLSVIGKLMHFKINRNYYSLEAAEHSEKGRIFLPLRSELTGKAPSAGRFNKITSIQIQLDSIIVELAEG